MAQRLATASLALLQLSIELPGAPPIAVAGFHHDSAQATLKRLHEKQPSTKKQVRVYIESGCPDSQQFCLNSLAYALNPDKGLAPFINVSLVAWGNAYHNGVAECKHITAEEYNHDGSHCWQHACKNGTVSAHCFNNTKTTVHQHGEKEGKVDRLINCAFKYAGSPWPYLHCLLTHYEQKDAVALADACTENTTDTAEREKLATAKACMQSDEGKALLMQAAQSTPKHPGVPYVTIDGESVDSDKFIEELCNRFESSEVPPACASRLSAAQTSATVVKAAIVNDGSLHLNDGF